jgi:HK97 gp10 family phage protein
MARGATIIGLAKLQKKLNRMPVVAKEAIKAAMAKQADEIVRMMKSLVPVDKGTLRESIGWTWGRAPKGSSIVAVAKASLAGDLTITIYAGSHEAFYARWQEFGTKNMRANPYFYVSWRANKKRAKSAVRRAINKAAKQVAAGK